MKFHSAATSDTFEVTVANVAPTVDAGAEQTVDEGSVVSLAPATFNDLGTADTHAATISWGDGTAPEAGVVGESPFGPPGSTAGADGTVAGSHVYADNGVYTVAVTVTDDDGAATSDTFEVTVTNVAPNRCDRRWILHSRQHRRKCCSYGGTTRWRFYHRRRLFYQRSLVRNLCGYR